MTRDNRSGGEGGTARDDSAEELSAATSRAKAAPPKNWQLRPAIREDVPRLVRLREIAYMLPLPELFRWPEEAFRRQLDVFPEGQLVIETEGRVVASSTTCRLRLGGRLPAWRSLNLAVWGEISGHRPDGDVLYLVDIVVHPLHRRRHHALHLCHAVQEFARVNRLHSVFVLARLPGFHAHASRMPAEEYVRRVWAGTMADESLSFWHKAGFRPQAVLPEIYPDVDSCGYAVQMDWMPAGGAPPFGRKRSGDSTMTGSLVDPDLRA